MEKLKWNTKIWPIAQKEAGKSKYGKNEEEEKKIKDNSEIVVLNRNMPINICIGINTLIKRQGLSQAKQKQNIAL